MGERLCLRKACAFFWPPRRCTDLRKLGMGRRPDDDHRQRSVEPLLADGRQRRQGDSRKARLHGTVGAHKGDTNTESNLIDTAITNKSVAIILDPANADGSVGAVKKAVAAGIPVILVNAEINQEGLAKAQLVSNNAQGAALGAQQWVEAVGDKGKYAELFGAPSDNNAATRSNGYETVLSPVSGPGRRSPRKSPTGIVPRATTRCSPCCRPTPISSASFPATTKWRSARSPR
jgi:hypothetical protein